VFYKYALIAAILIIFAASAVLADGGFLGDIEYRDCDCEWGDGGDFVKVQRVGYAPIYTYPVSCSWTPGYDTRIGNPSTFPPGTYNIWVTLGEDSKCDKSLVQQVVHDSTDQRVNLIVLGRAGQPDGDGD
jgi:hypothetical protein